MCGRQMERIEGKVAFVTGAASGIGLGIARTLVGAGVKVVLTDVEESALQQAHAEFTDSNVETIALPLDVRDRAAWAHAADEAESRLGNVHILCNNAGVASGGPVDQLTYDDWDWVLGVNLHGVINGITTFASRIKRHGEGGHIVNTSSILGHRAGANQAIYSASKYAVLAISEAAREDLAPYDIGVSALCPGLIDTNIITSARNRPEGLGSTNRVRDEAMVEQAKARFAQGLDPDRVGEMVLDGIRRNKAYIFTHAGLKRPIEERFKRIMECFDGSEA